MLTPQPMTVAAHRTMRETALTANDNAVMTGKTRVGQDNKINGA
jgi:hypothetical protein